MSMTTMTTTTTTTTTMASTTTATLVHGSLIKYGYRLNMIYIFVLLVVAGDRIQNFFRRVQKENEKVGNYDRK